MARLVDEQVSLNSSVLGELDIPITKTPELFGTLGLDTSNTGPTLRVEFDYTLEFSYVKTSSFLISIYRGVGDDAVLVFQTQHSGVAGDDHKCAIRNVASASGVDYLPPNPGFLIYQAFVSTTNTRSSKLKRIGPESFAARAYSD
ncbi:hypothetical protein [Paenibacillus taiwanensis]|uniref:hypothetical protein n=1 Tax=Paenibacillus taiwanensis TaxID=401638 RepID=UPI000404D687|nr:hypothetical protein [Paenibacillus taiwanensis]